MSLLRSSTRRRIRRFLRRALVTLAVLAVLSLTAFILLNGWMVHASSGEIYSRLEGVPVKPVALVLGAGPGTEYLEHRLDAAAKLYFAGKVGKLLVSGAGDAADPTGSETYLMRQGLIARGVPATAILRDEEGWRTLDSVARAKRVSKLDSVIIVSQSFHLPRALYLARHWGLDAVGFAADDSGGNIYNSDVREWFARVLAIGDVVFDRQPRSPLPPEPVAAPPAGTAPKPATSSSKPATSPASANAPGLLTNPVISPAPAPAAPTPSKTTASH